MALKGNLRDFSTTQLLNLINLARKTGTLTIEGDEVASVSFREGKLIHAGMGNGQSGLAHVLYVAGKLSEEQANVIKTRARNAGDKQLGHQLIQAGYVTQSDIIQSVRQYILDIVYKLFTWTEGLFRFDANLLPSNDRLTIPINLESVIMEGSRRVKEWARLQEELPDLDIRLKFSDRPDARLRNISLTVEEWRVISFINPRNTARQIAQANNLSEFQIRRIIYGLLQAGIVQIVPESRPRPVAAVAAKAKRSERRPTGPAAAPQSPEEKRSIVTRLISRIRSL